MFWQDRSYCGQIRRLPISEVEMFANISVEFKVRFQILILTSKVINHKKVFRVS